jgi:protein O-mannosyl-transferase
VTSRRAIKRSGARPLAPEAASGAPARPGRPPEDAGAGPVAVASRAAPRARSPRPERPAAAETSLPRWLPPLALLVLTLVAYLPALGAGFVWDDNDYVTANATLRSLGGLARIWLQPGAVPQYYPLTFTTLWLDFQIGGLEPFGYHLVNVLLHAANAILAWRILVRLGVPGAWLAGALFAVHPVHVESVAWVTERKNVLSGAFYLGAMLAYLRFAGIGAEGGRRPAVGRGGGSLSAYALALVLFLGGLLAKTVVCTLPVALLLLLWWKRGRIVARDLALVAPFFALGVALALVTVSMERGHVGAVGSDWDLSFVDRCLIAGRAVWFYLGKLVWPLDLVFIYPRWTIDAGAPWQYVFPAAGALFPGPLFSLCGGVGARPLVAVLFFVATLGPALGFVNVFPMRYSFVADHFQYLASLGPIALAAGTALWAAKRLGGSGSRARTVGVVLASTVIAALALLTARQSLGYRDLRTLWEDTLAKNPGAWMAHNNLGLLDFEAGRLDAAMAHYRAAIAVKPDDAFARNNLGRALATEGRLDDAIVEFREAVRVEPGHAEAWSNLGNALAAQGRYEDAIVAYVHAVEARPRYADARSNLGNVLLLTGRTADAIAAYESAIALDPEFADVRYNLGVALAGEGRLGEAEIQLVESIRIRPSAAGAYHVLGDVLAKQGRYEEAVARQREALRLEPGWTDAERALAAAEAARAGARE